MATLIIRAIYTAKTGNGDNFTYTLAPWFTDVSNDPLNPFYSPYYKYIQKMRDLGITNGCTVNTYCPTQPATNGSLAVFTVRAWQIVNNMVGPPTCYGVANGSSYEFYSNEPN